MVFVYLLYAFSGIIKSLLLHFNIELPVDFTFLTASLLVIAIFFDFYKNSIKVKFKKLNFIAILLLLVFYFWLLFSLIYTHSPDYSKLKSFYFLTNIIAFIYPLIIKKFDYIKFIKYFTVTALIFSAYFVANYYLIKLVSSLQDTNADKMYLVLSTILGICIVLILTSKKVVFSTKLIDNIILFLGIILMLLLGARGPIIFVVFVYIIFVIRNLLKKQQKNIKKKHLLTVSVSTILFFIIIIIVFAVYSEKINPLLERSLKRFEILLTSDDNFNKNISFFKRIDQLKYTVNKIFDNTFNFAVGYGIGSFNIIYNGEDGRGYPHNIFLEIWFELGVIGFLLFSVFIAYVFLRRKRNLFITHFVLIYIFLNMAKSNSLIDIRIYFMFFALFLLPQIEDQKKLKFNNLSENNKN